LADRLRLRLFLWLHGGETSQYEPRLFENTLPIEPPRDETYHLSSDMAEKALAWLRKHRAFAPDKPFLMYWAPGARTDRIMSSRNGGQV